MRSIYSGQIKAKGWIIKEVLKYWGRSQDWFQRNSNGDDQQKIRLQCMIDGLPGKTNPPKPKPKTNHIPQTVIPKDFKEVEKPTSPICPECNKRHGVAGLGGFVVCGCGNTFEWGASGITKPSA